MIEKYYLSNNLKNVAEKKNDAIISKTKKPFKQLAYLDSSPEIVEPKIKDSEYEKLLDESIRYYDEYARVF